MRSSILFPAALVSLGVAAQAPADLVQCYNDEVPAVTRALKDLRYREACARADALVPSRPPVFQPKEIGQSLESGKGMLAILKLQANTLAVSGQWEKAREVCRQRVAYAETLRGELNGALASLEADWKRTLDEGRAYLAENEGRAAELEKRLLALQADIQAFNEKKVKLDSRQLADLKARAAQAPKQEELLGEMKGRVAWHRDAVPRHEQFALKCSEFRQAVDSQIQEARVALDKVEGSLKGQAAEIDSFNRGQNARQPRPKVPVTGAKAWVAAVMKVPGNLSKLPTSQEQANILHRFLVLDPENQAAARALANLEQGREPFSDGKVVQKKPSPSK
ncbi:hypothetical protein [Holophaga foetida]|uniref:hypothetical protein n=1 Tax=Holophaga foetida TaxID=35839 RepID=UPI0002472EC9|nr:hypothetical protein [Holophaga foetida]